jgi:hypothetical protein
MGVPNLDEYLPVCAATDWGSIAAAVVAHPSDPKALATADAQAALRCAGVIAQVVEARETRVPAGMLLRSCGGGEAPACLTSLAASGDPAQRRAGDVLARFLQADQPSTMLQNWDMHALAFSGEGEPSALDSLVKVLTECAASENPNLRRVAAWCLTQVAAAFRRPPSYISGGAVSALTAVKRSTVRQELAAVVETL